MKIHDVMAENRVRFAQKLNEMSDELSNLVKEVEKTRKQVEITESYSTRVHDHAQHLPLSLDKGPCHTIRARSPGVRVYGRKNQGSI